MAHPKAMAKISCILFDNGYQVKRKCILSVDKSEMRQLQA